MLESSQLETTLPAPAPAVASPLSGAVARVAVPLYAATLFLSSFLMFAVEPMVARRMLPILGGVPMVWNGCVVFFQTVLLLGYGGAHVLTRWFASSLRLVIYAGLAVIPLAFLHLGVEPPAGGQATSSPLAWLLLALVTSVGPAFLALAVSASVLQASLASSTHESGRDPYFLYVASNAGSLTALVAYPAIIEPWLGLAQQAHVWTIGYGVFVALVLACAVVARYALSSRPAEASAAVTTESGADQSITWGRRARWCALACVPSSLMLGVTTAITTDIAPIPLLWVVPLGLYLLTFVIAFSKAEARATALADRLLPPLLLPLAVALFLSVTLPVGIGLLVHWMPFFAAALLCHGQLARERPSSRHLTEFYFWLAFGGMVGGLFNTLAAPALFSSIVEYPIALTLLAFLRPRRSQAPQRSVDVWLPIATLMFVGGLLLVPWMLADLKVVIVSVIAALAVVTMTRRQRPATFAAVVGILLLSSPWLGQNQATLDRERTFFGSYRVSADGNGHHILQHGTTLHGMQSLDPARATEPLTYYHRTGPFGRMLDAIPRLREPGRIAAIGLGVGTLATYAEPGQQWTFFEIDPAIERIARDRRYFTFLDRCGSACQVVLGDARLSLASRRDDRYQLMALDAFSSDAIPLHLVTSEALKVYLAHLAAHGVIAFHVSNRHLALSGVVGRLALDNGLVALSRRDRRGTAPWPQDKTPSEWVVMARSREDLGALASSPDWASPATADTPLWTDDFSSILAVLHFGRF